MYKIVSTPEAELDYRNIFEYIAYNFKMPKIAINLISSIKIKINSLKDAPKRYKIFDEEPWRSRELHYFIADKYLVFYLVKDETKEVWIMRIMHQGMDYKYNLDSSSEHYFVSDHSLEEIYNEGLEKNKLAKSLGMTVEQLDRELEKGYQDILNGRTKDFKKTIEDIKKDYGF